MSSQQNVDVKYKEAIILSLIMAVLFFLELNLKT
jgi:hypothetical protein